MPTRPPRRCSTPGAGAPRPGSYGARDDRPWDGTDPPAVAYVYAPDRKAERPSEHLAGFAGVLQVDGYAGYNALARSNQVQLAYCWSHVRRGFFEIAASRPALVRIAKLDAVEKDIRGRSPDDRRAARQELSMPLVADLRRFLETSLTRASKKGKLADAIRYALSRWTGLSRFLDDGRIEIDSNTVERSIRPVALNRKADPGSRSAHNISPTSSRQAPLSGAQPLRAARLGAEALPPRRNRYVKLASMRL